MISYFKKHLSAKVLVVLVVILAGSFTGLGLSVIAKQGELLGEMRESVYNKLNETGEEAQQKFSALEVTVSELFSGLETQTSILLTSITAEALSAEEQNLSKTMEGFLVRSAETAASVLSKIAQESIMSKNYEQLVDFGRLVSQTEEIVFVIFLDKEGNALPSYVNLVDDQIVQYMENAGATEVEERAEQAKIVLAAAKEDSSVMLHESGIEYYGLNIGTTIVCVSKDAVIKEIANLSDRFDSLKQSNADAVKSIIGQESTKVTGRMKEDLSKVVGENNRAIQETGDILDSSAEEVKSGTTWVVLLVGIICCLGVIAAVAIMLKIIVIQPILEITGGLRDTAEGEGDLTKRLNIDRTDEIGMLAKWFDTFVAKLNNIIVDIRTNSETVTSSAFEVVSATQQMQGETEELKDKASSVAAASEEMDVSMNSVAAVSEEASTNISFVAEAAADMKMALDGVVSECDQAKEVSHSAADQVQSATEKVSLLGDAAREISNVSEVITDIAEQTNLLALNATIEAARAGDAGKGFAVVASEIKELAQQTQKATQQIKAKIESIQTSTNDTVEEVSLISGIIADVDSIMSSIASSMTEQSGRAAEVAKNIEQASIGIAEVNSNVMQSSQVSAQIAADVSEVNTVTEEMSSRTGEMRTSSEGLSNLATQLREMISIFKVSLENNK